jgi:hypothetical protein
MRRTSGFDCGLRSGWARSMRASTQEPASIRSAKSRAWLAARARSPSSAARGSAVSACARSTSPSPIATSSSAICRRNAARRAGGSAA